MFPFYAKVIDTIFSNKRRKKFIFSNKRRKNFYITKNKYYDYLTKKEHFVYVIYIKRWIIQKWILDFAWGRKYKYNKSTI